MSKPAELSVGSLEEEAYKRRERLKTLKRKFQETKTNEKKPIQIEAIETEKIGETNDIDETTALTIATATTTIAATTTDKPIAEDVVTVMETQLDTLKEPLHIDEIDITNLAPRKPDWDLKRDVSKKLELLEKRTQRAIAELIRERLKTNQGTVDLQAVNVLSGRL